MNEQKIQKEILEIIKIYEGRAIFAFIVEAVKKDYPSKNVVAIVENNLKILIDDGKVICEKEPSITTLSPLEFYRLTTKGYRELDSSRDKFWRFLIWEKHNLFSLLTFIISLVSLVLSVVALWVNFKR